MLTLMWTSFFVNTSLNQCFVLFFTVTESEFLTYAVAVLPFTATGWRRQGSFSFFTVTSPSPARMVEISPCMKAQGTVDPARGQRSPLGQ